MRVCRSRLGAIQDRTKSGGGWSDNGGWSVERDVGGGEGEKGCVKGVGEGGAVKGLLEGECGGVGGKRGVGSGATIPKARVMAFFCTSTRTT